MQQKSRYLVRNAIMRRWGLGTTLLATAVWGGYYLIFGYVPETSLDLCGVSITLSRWTDMFLGAWIVLGIWVTIRAIEKGCFPFIYSVGLFTIVAITWIFHGLPNALVALMLCLAIGVLILVVSLIVWVWEKLKIGETIQNLLDRAGNYMVAQDVQNKLDAEAERLKKKAKRKKKK